MNKAHDLFALRSVDLNLLVAFDALLRERSVTRAARRMGVTQSAMSHTLRRLRVLFDDPLLVRGQGGLVPTPRAEELCLPVRSGLISVSQALTEPAPFDARRSQRAFRMVGPDLFDVLALPLVLRAIRQRAPDVDLAVLPGPTRDLVNQLETGDVDLAILPVFRAAAPDAGAPDLRRRILFRDDLRCFFRPDHPLLGKRRRLTLAAFVKLAHLLVSPTGEGPGIVDLALEEHGLRRRVALRLSHFSPAPAIVAQSDLILTAPSALAAAIALGPKLSSLPCPLPVGEHAVTMVWHPRFSEDPGHRWLRELLVEVASDLPGIAAR